MQFFLNKAIAFALNKFVQ